jgi:hypothetical protein
MELNCQTRAKLQCYQGLAKHSVMAQTIALNAQQSMIHVFQAETANV